MHRGCTAPAEYFQVFLTTQTLNNSGQPVFPGQNYWYCAAHVHAVARRGKKPVFEHYEEALAAAAERRAQEQEQAELIRAEWQRRDEETLAREGRLLVLSGWDGQMFRLPDGSLAIRLNGSETLEPVCCWHQGGTRIGQRMGAAHSPDCPHAGA